MPSEVGRRFQAVRREAVHGQMKEGFGVVQLVWMLFLLGSMIYVTYVERDENQKRQKEPIRLQSFVWR